MTMRTPVAAQIESAMQAIPGWTPLDQLLALFTIAQTSAHLGGDILEIGSWCGRSAVALGLAARMTGQTTVHCVDLFPARDDWHQNADGSWSMVVEINGKTYGAYNKQTVWAEPFARDIVPVYERFTGTQQAFEQAMATNALQDYVKLLRGDLEDFADQAPDNLKLRMAFVDGDHSFEAVSRDIAIIERFLLPGGWICFDDAFSSYEGVNAAIDENIIHSGRYHLCQQLTRKCFVASKR